MSRLRYNGLTSTLSIALSGTTVTFPAALTHSNGTPVPTIDTARGDYVPLSVLTPAGILLEIVYLTAYTAGALSGTVTRAQEGTPNASRPAGSILTCAPTTTDLGGAAAPSLKPSSLHPTYGDDFTGGSLDPKWTRGVYTSADETYRDGADASWMSVVPMRGSSYYIQTVTGLADFTISARMALYVGQDVCNIGILATDATGAGQSATFHTTASSQVYCGAVTGFTTLGAGDLGYGRPPDHAHNAGEVIYLRLRRVGSNWQAAGSWNGVIWSPWTAPHGATVTVTRVGFVVIGSPNTGQSAWQLDYFNLS